MGRGEGIVRKLRSIGSSRAVKGETEKASQALGCRRLGADLQALEQICWASEQCAGISHSIGGGADRTKAAAVSRRGVKQRCSCPAKQRFQAAGVADGGGLL
ncbi:hypothetical protein ACJRO7_027870 [Eucalyptus globulus]|uniref:Uncharacterized protein n=1 Tax=Eucalyptus globulus TaxID=34317 RepID=A0ABD3JXJ6_EUCGL